jgi:cell wall-associated NlpC family hydrolase
VTPQIGDYGVVATYGNWHNRLAGWAIRFGTDSKVNHAFVYVGGGQIVEAAPGGARINDVDAYDNITWSHSQPWAITRHHIAHAARGMVGTPYGWLDIFAIALAQGRTGRLVNDRTWWVKRVQRTDRLICSQLVDLAYQQSGIHLFNDGRLPGLVSPGDLAQLIR